MLQHTQAQLNALKNNNPFIAFVTVERRQKTGNPIVLNRWTTEEEDITIGGITYTADAPLKDIDGPKTEAFVHRSKYDITFLDPNGDLNTAYTNYTKLILTLQTGLLDDDDTILLPLLQPFKGFCNYSQKAMDEDDGRVLHMKFGSTILKLDDEHAVNVSPSNAKSRDPDDDAFDRTHIPDEADDWGGKVGT